MSYSHVGDHPFPQEGPKDDICDYIDQPLDLNQENIRLFEQQQYHQNHPVHFQQYSPQNGPMYQGSPQPYIEQGSPAPYIKQQHSSPIPQWQGHPNGAYVEGYPNGNGEAYQMNYVSNVPQEPLLRAESVSSTQLSGEREGANLASQWNQGAQNPNGVGNNTDSSLHLGSPNDYGNEKGKSKKPRARILTDKEEAVMNKDDLELSEEELKIKKKAHNRLAQRAFRERKRTELKDLESKLLQSEEERQKLLKVLQDIKLAKSDENLLRSGGDPTAGGIDFENSRFSFPSSQEEFINHMVDVAKHNVNPDTVNKVYEQPENPGRKVLAVGAVWDYLQIKAEEEGYEGVDMYDVMQLLKGSEKCHGYGPAYELELVNASLEQIRSQVQGNR